MSAHLVQVELRYKPPEVQNMPAHRLRSNESMALQEVIGTGSPACYFQDVAWDDLVQGEDVPLPFVHSIHACPDLDTDDSEHWLNATKDSELTVCFHLQGLPVIDSRNASENLLLRR